MLAMGGLSARTNVLVMPRQHFYTSHELFKEDKETLTSAATKETAAKPNFQLLSMLPLPLFSPPGSY